MTASFAQRSRCEPKKNASDVDAAARGDLSGKLRSSRTARSRRAPRPVAPASSARCTPLELHFASSLKTQQALHIVTRAAALGYAMDEPRRHQLDLQKDGKTVGAAAPTVLPSFWRSNWCLRGSSIA